MKHILIIKSFFEFIIFKVKNSEKWFYKSLTTYKKNYFSIIHSGKYNLNDFAPTVQYMMANTLNKNIDPLILRLSIDFFSFCNKYKNQSNSQFLQDLFVLYFLNIKRNGFFVEFGACDGIDLSNTLILEKKLNWNGILAEPDKYYFESLQKNRNCLTSNLIVFNKSDLVKQFTHVYNDPKLSTISDYINNDSHKSIRSVGEVFDVRTITLDNLLDSLNAPNVIDFISIDTEGSELEIIEAFSFSRKVLLWTIEHNHNQKARNRLQEIFKKRGFKRVLEGFSECDDWYVEENTLDSKIRELMQPVVL